MSTSSLLQTMSPLSANEITKNSEAKTNSTCSPMATGSRQPEGSFVDMAYRHTTDIYSTDESSSSQSESGSESDTDGSLVGNVLMGNEWEEEEEREEGEGGGNEGGEGEEREVIEVEEEEAVQGEGEKSEGEQEGSEEEEEERIASAVWTLPVPGLNQLRSKTGVVPTRVGGGPHPGKQKNLVETKNSAEIHPLQQRQKACSTLFSLPSSSMAPLATAPSSSASALIPSTRGLRSPEVAKTGLSLNGTAIYPTVLPGPAQNATNSSKQLSTSSLASTPTPNLAAAPTRASTGTTASTKDMFVFTGQPSSPILGAARPIVGPSSQDQIQNIHIHGHPELKLHKSLLEIPPSPDDEAVAAHLCSRFPVFEAMHEWMQASLLHPCPRMEYRSNHMETSARQGGAIFFSRAAPQLVFERPWRSGRYRGTRRN